MKLNLVRKARPRTKTRHANNSADSKASKGCSSKGCSSKGCSSKGRSLGATPGIFESPRSLTKQVNQQVFFFIRRELACALAAWKTRKVVRAVLLYIVLEPNGTPSHLFYRLLFCKGQAKL